MTKVSCYDKMRQQKQEEISRDIDRLTSQWSAVTKQTVMNSGMTTLNGAVKYITKK